MENNKYIIKGIIKFSSAIHIGGGKINEMNTDSPIVKTPDGEPYIPGSSFKGAFRSFVERIVLELPNIKTCQLDKENLDCPTNKKIDWKDKDESQVIQELDDTLCDTCKLFGSTHKASKIFFRDLNIDEWAGVSQVRDGVVIDRDSGTAVPDLKYDFEIIPTDAEFKLLISAEAVNQKDLGLLSIGINELLSGNFRLGGKTTRGLGDCQLEDTEIFYSDWNNPEHLKKYLMGTSFVEKYTKIENVNSFLSDNINSLFS